MVAVEPVSPSTSSSPSAGPSAIATATARFSSTTGDGESAPPAGRRGARSASQSVSASKVEGGDRRLQLVRTGQPQWQRPLERRPALRDLVRRSRAERSCSSSRTSSPAGEMRASRRASCRRRSACRPCASASSGMSVASTAASRIASRAQLAADGRSVAGVEDEVDRRRARPQPFRQQVLGRHAQRDAGVADLPLRADEPLRERRLRDEEGARDLGRLEAADEAQRQTRPAPRARAPGGSRRRSARAARRGWSPPRRPGAPRPARAAPSCAPASARGGSGRSPRSGPSSRSRRPDCAGTPRGRPALGRPDEGVLHRVLGEIEVTEDAAEDRDRAGTLVAVCAGELLYDATSASRITIGRTSMWP